MNTRRVKASASILSVPRWRHWVAPSVWRARLTRGCRYCCGSKRRRLLPTLWFKTIQPTIRVICKQIDVAVGAGPDIPDTPQLITQQLLLMHHFFTIHLQPQQVLFQQGSDEQVSLPPRKLIAKVEGHP